MAVSVFSSSDEDVPFDPDTLKMPENPVHREAIEAIAFGAIMLRKQQVADGADPVEVYRDMNWYPPDGGTAMAPDVMVLPVGAMATPKPNSYRQDQTGGPPPFAVVEVPSASDTYAGIRAKASRCGRLGVPVYVVLVEEPGVVERFEPGDTSPLDWHGRPIPELGGLRIQFDDSVIQVALPDGVRGASASDLAEAIANARVERFADQLRSLGAQPAIG